MSGERRDALGDWVRAATAAGPDCPTPEELMELASDQLEPSRAARLRRHLSEGCARCAAEMELARSFLADDAAMPELDDIVARLEETTRYLGGERDAASPDGSDADVIPIPEERRDSPRWAPWALAAAAMLVLAIGVGVVPGPWSRPSLPERAGGPLRGQQLRVVTPLGDLATPPERLEWTAVDGATSYRVRVSRPGGETVWEATTGVTTIALTGVPDLSILAHVRYVVRVEALTDDGTVVARSEGVRFEVQESRRP